MILTKISKEKIAYHSPRLFRLLNLVTIVTDGKKITRCSNEHSELRDLVKMLMAAESTCSIDGEYSCRYVRWKRIRE